MVGVQSFGGTASPVKCGPESPHRVNKTEISPGTVNLKNNFYAIIVTKS
jgi:hypothetical protein